MEIVTALTAMKSGIELATVALEARDDRKIREAIGDIAARLVDAQMDALTTSTALRKLDAELRDATEKLRAAEERERQRAKYVLRAIAEGIFAYAFVPVDGDETPAHYKCQICFDRGESSVLVGGSDADGLICRNDQKHFVRIRVSDRGSILVGRLAGR